MKRELKLTHTFFRMAEDGEEVESDVEAVEDGDMQALDETYDSFGGPDKVELADAKTGEVLATWPAKGGAK